MGASLQEPPRKALVGTVLMLPQVGTDALAPRAHSLGPTLQLPDSLGLCGSADPIAGGGCGPKGLRTHSGLCGQLSSRFTNLPPLGFQAGHSSDITDPATKAACSGLAGQERVCTPASKATKGQVLAPRPDQRHDGEHTGHAGGAVSLICTPVHARLGSCFTL